MNTNNLPVKASGRKIECEMTHLGRVEKGDYMGCTLESVTELNQEKRNSIKSYIEAKSKEYGLFVGDLRSGLDIAGFDNPYDEINNLLLQAYESLRAGWHCQFAMMDAMNKLEKYENRERLQRPMSGTFLHVDEIERIKAMFRDKDTFVYYLRALYALRYVAYKAATYAGIVDKQNPMYPLWELSDMLIKCLYRPSYDYTPSESSEL